MTPTDGQLRALRALGPWLQAHRERVAILTGPAGSGKTTLLKLLIRAAELLHRPVVVLAPTGKAALRIREVTARHASTVHKFLYQPITSDDDVRFMLRSLEDLENDRGALVIVDEASMIGRKVWHHLLGAAEAVDMQILLVGDTFQLEPVQDERDGVWEPLQMQVATHAHLDEVVRQALDSPVLRAATGVRLARSSFDVQRALAELTVLVGRSPAQVAAERPDVPILVHRNATRHEINRKAREIRGLPADPTADEPLLVKRNNYRVQRFNGEIVRIHLIGKAKEAAVKNYKKDENGEQPVGHVRYALIDVEGDRAIVCLDEIAGETQGRFGDLALSRGTKEAWRQGLTLPGEDEPQIGERPSYLSCNYGYCLTTHSAQGSEWDTVLVVVEPSIGAYSSVSARRHIYTSITRAKKEVLWTTL